MRVRIPIVLIILINLFASAHVTVASNDTTVPPEAYEWYSRYVTFLPKSHIDSVLQYASTDIVPVKFKLYKTNINPNPELDSITSLINRVNKDERVKLAYVWIGGSASPDGRLSLNTQLAQRRGQALADYIKANTNISANQLRFDNLGEDWYTITEAIKNSNSEHKNAILGIIASEIDLDRREQKLKQLNNGAAWDWLKQEILPRFRNARLVIVCSAEDIKVEPIEKVESHPQQQPQPDTIPNVTPNVVEIPEQHVDTVTPEPEPIKTWFIAAKTNLLWLAGTVANVGVEVQFAEKWSIDIPVYYSPYNLSSDHKIRVLATQPELRYWLEEQAGAGHFVGLHGHLMGFNVAINDHGRYQDAESPLWGFGIGYGYAVNWGKEKNWGMEFNIGLGFANYKYDKFYNLPNGQKCGEGEEWYYGLTRAGVTLTYKWWIPRRAKIVKGITD